MAADLPDVFLPYQQRLAVAVSAAELLVVEKSRRTGFSWALGGIAAMTAAAAKSAGGQDVLYMGYEKDMTREFIDYVADFGKLFQLAATEVQEFVWINPDKPEQQINAFRITFASGFEVVALPSVARALRGKQGIVILDEAAFMDDLSEVLKAALALLMWGGKVVVCSTHNGEMNPFNGLINDIRGGRRRGAVMRLTFEEALAEGLCKRILLTQGKVWSPEAEAEWREKILAIYADNADEELHVIPNPASGVYIPSALIEACALPSIPVLRLTRDAAFSGVTEQLRRVEIAGWIRDNLDPVLATLNPALPHCFGFDFARSGDLSVLAPIAIWPNMMKQMPFVLEMRGVPFAQQKQVLWHALERLPRKRAGKMDAGGNGQQIAEETVEKFGSWIEAVMLTEGWYRDNMPALKAAFEDRLIGIPRDRAIIDDVLALKLVRGIARVPARTNDAGGKRHGDFAIAGALAIAASRADPEIYAYDPVRPFDGDPSGRPWQGREDTWAEDNQPPRRSHMLERAGSWL